MGRYQPEKLDQRSISDPCVGLASRQNMLYSRKWILQNACHNGCSK